jgi:hypothetical protein
MITSPMQQFTELVWSDTALIESLSAFNDRRAFVTAVIEQAALRGIALAEQDIAAAMNAGMRGWIERWI